MPQKMTQILTCRHQRQKWLASGSDLTGLKIDVVQGNIDLNSTHKQIVDIMEGGKEAFDKRQLIYASWH